jgi:UDP-N-acetylglucosamine 2-epimerase
VLIHTGQHYDYAIAGVLRGTRDSGARSPSEVGSGRTPGRAVLGESGRGRRLAPDLALVFGDTNSTLGAALAAAKLRVPLAHVEAGVRTGMMAMAEEQNRVVVDHASDLLFAPTQDAVRHLEREGARGAIHLTGDVMRDALEQHLARARTRPDPALRHGVAALGYLLLTVHRAENTDDPTALGGSWTGSRSLEQCSSPHPRTRAAIERAGLTPLAASLSGSSTVGYLTCWAQVPLG